MQSYFKVPGLVPVTSPRGDALSGVVVCRDEVVLLGVLQPRLLVLAVLLLLQPADVAHQQHLVLGLGQSWFMVWRIL